MVIKNVHYLLTYWPAPQSVDPIHLTVLNYHLFILNGQCNFFDITPLLCAMFVINLKAYMHPICIHTITLNDIMAYAHAPYHSRGQCCRPGCCGAPRSEMVFRPTTLSDRLVTSPCGTPTTLATSSR